MSGLTLLALNIYGCACVYWSLCQWKHIIYLLLFEGVRTPQQRIWTALLYPCCDFSTVAFSTTVLTSEQPVCFDDAKCVSLRLLRLLPPLWYDITTRLQEKLELYSRRLTSGQVGYYIQDFDQACRYLYKKKIQFLHSRVTQHNTWKALSDVEKEFLKGPLCSFLSSLLLYNNR